MAFGELKKRQVSVTTDGSGDATALLSLGAAYAQVVAVKLDSGADVSSDYSATDGDGRTIFAFTGVNASTPVERYLVVAEASVFDDAGEVAAADSAVSVHPVAKSRLNLTIANGGAAETHVVTVYAR